MISIDLIITEHLGKDWFLQTSYSVDELQVLLDKLQDQGFSLRRSVWQILAIAALNDRYGNLWLQIPSQSRVYVMDLIGLWGDLKAAKDYFDYPYRWGTLLTCLEAAVTNSGLDSSNLPS